MKIVKGFGMLMGLLVVSAGSKCAPPKEPATIVTPQHFVCNIGYTIEKCHGSGSAAKGVEKYPAAQLGEWTWVLVRSSDWKDIKTARGLDRNSPAFTYYAGRETFLEEALVTEVPERQGALLLLWGMGRDKLLDSPLLTSWGMPSATNGTKAKPSASQECCVKEGRRLAT